jgi:hypothetical protein
MRANIDNRFIELLNERTGMTLTCQEFVAIYNERKKERDSDPRILTLRPW